MSAKDAGVDALSVLCSSGDMCVGSEETSVMAILYARRVRLETRDRREEEERTLAEREREMDEAKGRRPGRGREGKVARLAAWAG